MKVYKLEIHNSTRWPIKHKDTSSIHIIARKAHTSIRIARSTTRLVTYPRTRPITLLATDDDPISTSICQIQKTV